jgi:hypothetical protein
MRLIDADELLNRTANLEAVALEQVAKYEPSENPREWHRWTAILTERTAFKYDLMDAPTIDAEPIRHGHWIFGQTMGHSWMKCSECCVSQGGQTATFTYCPNCGAKMDEVEE